ARKDLFNIVDRAITDSSPIQILSKKGGAVLVSLDDWTSMQETIYLSSIPGFVESVKNTENEEWFDEDEVDW
ncbi:MAG: type II toxin-antitoxin system Phd/YefM family antitoxin, partial [Defluviitaleaceae bacterium]|nr:type II toxin-antitoxin system Phd/YefM family antitoxin [Defluviitaleaceae bacterium]